MSEIKKKELNENIIDIEYEKIDQKTEENKNEIIKLEDNDILDLYTDSEFKKYNLVPLEDEQYLKDHIKDYQERFINRSFFRSEFEMRYGVLSDAEHPTPDSKYFQSIGEQAVHINEYLSLEFEQKKLMADIELTQAHIEDLEYQLTKSFEYEFDKKKIEAKLKKKQIQLQEKNYGLILQRKTAKERMKEIKNWDKIIAELEPQLKYGKDDFEKHHAERYIKRYGQRLQNFNILSGEEKEHVLKHFSSFSQAPENKELSQQYINNYQKINRLQNNQNKTLPRQENNKGLIESNNEQPKLSSQIDFKSKKEMMEQEPITQKFFNRKVRKILIATPHRTKEDPNVTNFFKMQTPAAYDVMIEQPYGYSVPDARNFIIDKAIKEDFNFIFFIDDDILIPRNALVQLIHHKADIVGGFYYRKYFSLESCGMIEDKNGIPIPIDDFKIGDIIHNTLVLPSGCTLINVDIFRKMEPPWYKTCTINGRPTVTEDTYICQRIRDLGYDIITDLGIQCIHINKQTGVLYGHPEIVSQEKNQVYEKYREYFAI